MMATFENLIGELAQLDPRSRTLVVAAASRRRKEPMRAVDIVLPTLSGGTAWIGGDLRREEMYGDDGR